MIPTIDSTQLQMYLGPRERLLWSGKPREGLFFRRGDALLVPMTALGLAFAVFWMFAAASSGAPPFFVAFGVPVVLSSLYYFAGRFLWDAAKRKRILYGLTDERVIIISNFPVESVDSLSLQAIPQLSFTRHRDGYGTITFGPEHRWYEALPSAGMSREKAPRLDYIREPDRIHSLIREAANSTP